MKRLVEDKFVYNYRLIVDFGDVKYILLVHPNSIYSWFETYQETYCVSLRTGWIK